jgi:hypothetical protein
VINRGRKGTIGCMTVLALNEDTFIAIMLSSEFSVVLRIPSIVSRTMATVKHFYVNAENLNVLFLFEGGISNINTCR